MKRLIFILLLLASPLAAVEPDEVLSDPALEARAREISQGLRCLVCRNESIDESNASLARDLRLLLRERLVAGDSDQQAVDFIVNRYGEYVLLKPDTRGANRLLWLAGPLMLLLAGGVGFGYLRSRSRATATGDAPLNADEEARLRDILDR
ncbi:cytochrome c-type biogenesis protein CcmH [Sulfitobacter brevis]|uniref:Cytochrome c-type biogenesis protein n=1 Tax=Sulfitobacter brevis TaxID=74348 RepID=A0A1I2CIW0_9RHOB|nr:cytochrome c-type biogenesis protein [Sulfitobacter brevis]SFE68319.1 cytochrome c-type biogenesis protein CcmH [Sulfitobacter brevis]